MEQKRRFGIILGRLALLIKKIGGRLSATFEGGFFMFSGAKKRKKKFENILVSTLKVA
jgi:hypothetical protein